MNLVVMLGEEPVAMPLSTERGLGLGFRAPPPPPFAILVGGCSEQPTHVALGTSLLASRTRSGTQCSSSLHPFQKGT